MKKMSLLSCVVIALALGACSDGPQTSTEPPVQEVMVGNEEVLVLDVGYVNNAYGVAVTRVFLNNSVSAPRIQGRAVAYDFPGYHPWISDGLKASHEYVYREYGTEKYTYRLCLTDLGQTKRCARRANED